MGERSLKEHAVRGTDSGIRHPTHHLLAVRVAGDGHMLDVKAADAGGMSVVVYVTRPLKGAHCGGRRSEVHGRRG